jgi:hypothetical protein
MDEHRRDGTGNYVTQAEMCSATDGKPCMACYECLWWEELQILPPGYEWVRSDQKDRRRYGG